MPDHRKIPVLDDMSSHRRRSSKGQSQSAGFASPRTQVNSHRIRLVHSSPARPPGAPSYFQVLVESEVERIEKIIPIGNILDHRPPVKSGRTAGGQYRSGPLLA